MTDEPAKPQDKDITDIQALAFNAKLQQDTNISPEAKDLLNKLMPSRNEPKP